MSFIGVVVFLWGHSAVPATKCPRLFVVVEGRLEGPVLGNETIEVKVEPEPHVKQRPIAVKDEGKFEAKVYFDTSNSEEREDCTRRPESATVLLRKDGELLQSIRLEIDRDFLREGWAPDFRVRQPVVLRSGENRGSQSKQ